MPNAIKKIGTRIPDKILKLYSIYPFEVYGIPYLEKELRKYGIFKNRVEYAECFEIAMIGYLYSIHRCACMNYTHTENYIKFMIRCCIKIGLVLANKDVSSLKSENYKVIYIDDENNRGRL